MSHQGTRAGRCASILSFSVALCLSLGAGTAPARAATFYDVTLDLGLRDEARVFLNVTNDYFAPQAAVAVDVVRRCASPVDDYPVILLLARASHRPADEILRMRLDYLTWSDIMTRVRVSPSVLFAGLDRDPGPPYGKAWGYWKKHPRGDSHTLRDRDVVELAKLQVAAGHQRVSPYAVISERNKGGTSIEEYVAERNRGRYARPRPGQAPPPSSRGKGHEKDKDKGHGHPHDHDH